MSPRSGNRAEETNSSLAMAARNCKRARARQKLPRGSPLARAAKDTAFLSGRFLATLGDNFVLVQQLEAALGFQQPAFALELVTVGNPIQIAEYDLLAGSALYKRSIASRIRR